MGLKHYILILLHRSKVRRWNKVVKKGYKIWIMLIYLMIVFLGLIISFQSADFNEFTSENALILSADSFMPNFKMHTLDQSTIGPQTYVTTFKKSQLKSESEIYKLLVYQLADNGVRVYLNDICIGSMGDLVYGNSNLSNGFFALDIDVRLVQEVNTLSFKTYANTLSGLKHYPLYIVDEAVGSRKFGKIDFFGENIILFGIGFVIFSSFISIILYIHTKRKRKDRSYIYSAIAAFLVGIYFLDYVKAENLLFSYLNYKKIIMSALFLGIGFYSLAIYRFFECRILKYVAYFTMIGFSVLMLLAKSSLQFMYFCKIWYVVVFINLLIWIISVIRNVKIHHQAYLFLISFIIGVIYSSLAYFFKVMGIFLNNAPIVYLVILATLPLLLAYEAINDKNVQLIHEKSLREIDFMQSITDELTETWNQRYLFTKLKEQEILYTIVMIDIDDFKLINDTYGHPAGDYVLKTLAKTLLKRLSDTDVLCRYGGDEFVLITYDKNETEIFELMELYRSHIDENPIVYNFKKIHVTLSIGIYKLNEQQSVETILKQVDEELYNSKTDGKNCTHIYNGESISDSVND